MIALPISKIPKYGSGFKAIDLNSPGQGRGGCANSWRHATTVDRWQLRGGLVQQDLFGC